MFKLYLKLIIVLLISNLTFAHPVIKLCESTPIDFDKFNMTEWDWNQKFISIATNNLMSKIRNDKELNNETRSVVEFNILALFNTFRVKNNEWEKFEKAVYDYNVAQILECIDFDITKSIKPNMISDPKWLNIFIDILQKKVKELKKHNVLTDIYTILKKELDNSKQKEDDENGALIAKLYSNIKRNFRTINQEKLLLEKVRNKDWDAALNLSNDPNAWKYKLEAKAMELLEEKINLNDRAKTNSLDFKRLSQLYNKMDEAMGELKNWEKIMWAILDKDWNQAIKLAEIVD